MSMKAKKEQRRCHWAQKPLMVEYHDKEWGRPVHDDRLLFEFLILEGAQAGLSWETILNKRENYRRAFDGFDAEKIARYDKRKVRSLLADAGIVRNRLKIAARNSDRLTVTYGSLWADGLRKTSGRRRRSFRRARPNRMR
jgi:DNA-3-methyladenine glycosylase I